MSDVLEIRVKKSHIAILSVVVLVASASAAVNVRDPMNVFGDLDMQGNEVQNTTRVGFSYDYLEKYAAQDGKIDISGVGQAGEDFASGELSAQELKTVDIYFEKGIPVTNDFISEHDNDGDDKIDIGELGEAGDEFASGELSFEELETLGYYFRNNITVSEPLSISAARKTGNGKLMATGVAGRQNSNFTVNTNINMQGNNIYNAANLNGGNTGGGGGGASNAAPPLDWSNAQPVNNEGPDDGTARIECGQDEVLRDVTCDRSGYNQPCDTRTEDSASVTNNRPGVSGTCVPIEGANAGVFTDQNTSNTFQVPPGASTVEYKVYGGVGGDAVASSTSKSGGNGGYVEGSFPVNGETTLNVYVGQDGANGVSPGDVLGGGRGGCVPFNGVKCGGDGGNGHFTDPPDFRQVAQIGGGGGGAPSIITNSENQIMIAAGGGAGGSMDSGGGGGAGGGEGAQPRNGLEINPGEDADGPIKNLGGDANRPIAGAAEAGDTFIGSDLPAADSTGTSSEGAKVVLSASP